MGLKDALNSMRPGSSSGDATHDGPSDVENISDTERAEKYLLRVSAGPAYDPSTHKTVFVNSPKATVFESESMVVKVRVRVQGYHGRRACATRLEVCHDYMFILFQAYLVDHPKRRRTFLTRIIKARSTL